MITKILVTMFLSLFDKNRLFFISMVVLRKSKGIVFRENVDSICPGKAEDDK